MGTWDTGSFDSDGAVDWTYGLEKVDDLTYIEAALDAVVEADRDEAIDSQTGENAVAAAEVVARLLGKWGESSPYSETADNWVRSHPIVPPKALVQQAIAALTRVTTAPSELLELWEETDAEGWLEAVAELKGRLS